MTYESIRGGTSSSRFGINNDTKIMKCAHELVWCVFFFILPPNIPATMNTCRQFTLYKYSVQTHTHTHTGTDTHSLSLLYLYENCVKNKNCVHQHHSYISHTAMASLFNVWSKRHAHGKAHRAKTRESNNNNDDSDNDDMWASTGKQTHSLVRTNIEWTKSESKLLYAYAGACA